MEIRVVGPNKEDYYVSIPSWSNLRNFKRLVAQKLNHPVDDIIIARSNGFVLNDLSQTLDECNIINNDLILVYTRESLASDSIKEPFEAPQHHEESQQTHKQDVVSASSCKRGQIKTPSVIESSSSNDDFATDANLSDSESAEWGPFPEFSAISKRKLLNGASGSTSRSVANSSCVENGALTYDKRASQKNGSLSSLSPPFLPGIQRITVQKYSGPRWKEPFTKPNFSIQKRAPEAGNSAAEFTKQRTGEPTSEDSRLSTASTLPTNAYSNLNNMPIEDVQAFCFFFYGQARNGKAFKERFQLFAESLIHGNYDDIAKQHQEYFFQMQEYLDHEQQTTSIKDNDDADKELQEVLELSLRTAGINFKNPEKTKEPSPMQRVSSLDKDAITPRTGVRRSRGPSMWRLNRLPKPEPMVPEQKQNDIGKMPGGPE